MESIINDIDIIIDAINCGDNLDAINMLIDLQQDLKIIALSADL